MRAALVVRNHPPSPTFVIDQSDSASWLRRDKAFVISCGSGLPLDSEERSTRTVREIPLGLGRRCLQRALGLLLQAGGIPNRQVSELHISRNAAEDHGN